MQVLPPALEHLVDQLSRLPGIGKKTAIRLALNILRRPEAQARELSQALARLHQSIRLCSTCFTFSETDPCAICGNTRRKKNIVCVVEQSADLLAIEKTASFQGVYHVLHGALAPIDGIGPDELKVKELLRRIATEEISEIIIATSSTVPGEATASYLIDSLQKTNIPISRIACGIPMGMDIKYADKYTLAKAIEGRYSTT